MDLFSGIAGFSIGLEKNGFRTIAFCEKEEYPRKVIKKHYPGIPIAEDVCKLTYNDQTKELIYDGQTIYRGAINAVCGGFPCQDISTAKTNNHISPERKGLDGERSGLWSEYARIIGEIRPKYTIMENVSALLSGDRGRWFQRILTDLAKIGYDCQWHCISASSIGFPHQRDRVWIVAYPHKTQLEGRRLSSRIYQEHANFSDSCRGQDKSGVVRTLNGISSQAHRLGCLGNAVVPQIPELLGRAIMKYEKDK